MRIAIKTKTVKEYKQATAFLYAFGLRYSDYSTYFEHLNNADQDEDYKEFPFILVDTLESDIDFSSEPYNYYTELTWIKDHDKIENALTLKSFTMRITDDYEATVTEQGIVVGCQTIEFDTFQELVKLVDRFNNR